MKYCIKCSYIVDYLDEHRCPECGRPFDPDDPKTYRTMPIRQNRQLVVVGMYCIPLTLSVFFWVTQDCTQWPSGEWCPKPDYYHIPIAAAQACGPLALALMRSTPIVAVSIFVLIWSGWLTVVCTSRLRNLHYMIHLFLGSLWCFAGWLPTAGILTW